MKKKRLVHVISSLKIGGAESLLIDMIERLTDNFEQHVVYFHDGPNVQRIKNLSIPTYRVSGLVIQYDPIFFKRLYSRISSLKPDVIHTSLWAANFTGRIIAHWLKIPVVCAVHLGINQDGIIRNALDRYTFGLATCTVAVSRGVADTIIDKQFLLPSQVDVIPNGIQVDAIVKRGHEQKICREDVGLKETHEVFGSVGRFIARKNYIVLIKSFSKVYAERDQARLILVGMGPEEKNLRSFVHRLGLDDAVIFVIGKSAYGYYPLFDCFILSSLQEGISIALLEAMSFSLPCIVTAPNEKHEIITSGENGVVVHTNDSDALAVTMSNIIRNKNALKGLGMRAYEAVVTRYTMEYMINSYRKIFMRLN